jgi:hypothetical protein
MRCAGSSPILLRCRNLDLIFRTGAEASVRGNRDAFVVFVVELTITTSSGSVCTVT